MPAAPDPYRTLGVVRTASKAQIKAAHRALAKRYHPDAPAGDTVRFLLVQEAYKLLSDPLRRREWDARHGPGPVRAGTAAPARPRGQYGRWTRPPDAPAQRGPTQAKAPRPARQARPPAREPAARRYTWSASEVPWWEEPGPRDSRRQPGRRRPHEGGNGAGAGKSGDGRPAGPPSGPTPGGQGGGRGPAQDFDVYNRSSGAAWSMAARAYFRRGEQDLPRRGSFHHQGTQPLTAARARVAAEEEARRAAGHGPRTETGSARQAGGASHAEGARQAAGRQAGARQGQARAGTAPPPDAMPRRDPAASEPARSQASGWTRAAPWNAAPTRRAAGVARDLAGISDARAAARRREQAARWPTLAQRLVLALIAWIPAALAIGFGGALATGCDRAAVSCPPNFETLQAVAMAAVMGLLVALPRVSYVAAMATAALAVAGVAVILGVWLLGLRPPLPGPVLALASVSLLILYLATVAWIVADRSGVRPWSAGHRR